MTIATFDNLSLSSRHIEEDKSLNSACRSSSPSWSMSDVSECALSRSSAMEADISTADSADEGSFSESNKSDGPNGSNGSTAPLTKQEAEKQLEKMSQAVMNAWSALQALESELVFSGNGQTDDTLVEIATVVEKPQSQHGSASLVSAGLKGRGPSGHAEALLHSAKHALDSTPGVAGTSAVVGNAGTLATLFIDMSPNAPATTRLSVCAIAKAALLEAAVSTEIVYVLGYEAAPFKDKDNGTGFAATLAIVPPDREFMACWDTITQGVCPRKCKCKWWHPGRDEIQPIQVIFR